MPQELAQYSFTQFADVFLAMHREGKSISIDEAIATFPHLEHDIREKLPSLMVLEHALGVQPEKQFPAPNSSVPVAGCYLGEELGHGAHGVVYRAYQPTLDREVAVKVIRLEADNQLDLRFERECKAMARLEHPNVVPIFEYSDSEHYAYLIMKLIEGYSFAKLLDDQTDYRGKVLLTRIQTDWTEFAKVALQIVDGLEHAHANGLIHRDIKPSNLLINQEGHVWITDFGLAKMHDPMRSLSQTGDIIGTPKYMSPEQLRGNCDERSDIYSLGLTLLELATGKLPEQNRLRMESDDGYSSIVQQSDHGIPEGLAKVIQKATAFSPEDRYQTAAELRHVLMRFLEGQVPDRRQGRRKPDDVFRKEYRKRMVLSVLASVSIFSVISYFLMIDSEPPQPVTNTLPMTRGPVGFHPESIGKKEQISQLFDRVVHEVESGDLDEESVSKLVNKYRDSGLSMGSRVARISVIIENSNLNPIDESRANQAVTRLSRFAVAKQLPRSEVEGYIRKLVPEGDLQIQNIQNMRLPVEQINAWTRQVERDLSKFGGAEPSVNLENEVQDIFDAVEMESPEKIKESIRSIKRSFNNEAEIRRQLDQLSPEMRRRIEQYK